MRTISSIIAVQCLFLGYAVCAQNALVTEPLQVQIQVQLVEIAKADANALLQNKPDGIPTKDAVLDMMKNGKAKAVLTPSLITQGGMEARIKAVEEYVYPTSWTIAPGTNPFAGGATGMVTVAPADSKTREVGLMLACLPEVSADGSIMQITLTLELGEPPVMKTYKAKSVTPDGKAIDMEIEQPVFYNRSMTAQVMIKNGETVMAGGGMPNRNGDKITYVLLTARLVDASGNARVNE